jgi:serine/threonine protein kinase
VSRLKYQAMKGTYERVKASAEAELNRLIELRHPNITYIFDAFECRDTFYLITERCFCPLTGLFALENFQGLTWLMPIARCLLQAVHYIHLNNYVHQDIHAGNVFTAFAKDEMQPEVPGAIQFKLGDLGVTKLLGDLSVQNTRAEWLIPPEVLDPAEFGPLDHRIDLYHVGLLLLQLAGSKEEQFSRDEILAGKPRDMALALSPPYNFALEKVLRRHVQFRTASAMELWRDLHTPEAVALAVPQGNREKDATEQPLHPT